VRHPDHLHGPGRVRGRVLLAAGTKGKRFALPHSRVLLHQPSGGAEGQSVDIEIQAREILRMRDLLNEILAEKTGQTAEKIGLDTDRDFILDAQAAKEYGLVDEIISSRGARWRSSVRATRS
jgi:ATP-dependent Clp protease, protease subunit